MQKALLRTLLVKSEFITVQGVSNILWSVAKLQGAGVWGLSVWDAVKEAAIKRASEAGPQALANMLWAASHLAQAPLRDEFVLSLCDRVPDIAVQMQPMHVSMSMNGLSKLRVRMLRDTHKAPSAKDHDGSDAELRSDESCLDVATRGHVGAILQEKVFVLQQEERELFEEWGLEYGRENAVPETIRRHEIAVVSLCSRAQECAEDMSSQGVSNILWALAAMNVQSDHVVGKYCDVLLARIQEQVCLNMLPECFLNMSDIRFCVHVKLSANSSYVLECEEEVRELSL